MTKSNKIYLAIILLFGIFNLYLVSKVIQLRKLNIPADTTAFDLLNKNYNDLFNKEFQECIDQNSLIADTLHLWDNKGADVTMKKLLPLKGKYKLVIRISQESCFTCFNQTFKMMNRYTKEIDQANLLYLGYFDDIPTMTTFMESNFGKVEPFDLQQKLLLKVEALQLPYIFILDANSRVHNVFVISKQNQQQVQGYLKAIATKYSLK